MFPPRILLSICAIFAATFSAASAEATRFERSAIKMGVSVRVVLYAENEACAENAISAAMQVFDDVNSSMSDYDSESEVSQLAHRVINKPVVVSEALAKVLIASREFAEISDGAFDVTVAPLVKLWRRARRENCLPPSEQIAKAKKLVGNEHWSIDTNMCAATLHSVTLHTRGVRFDLGGIAKGFAIDRAFEAARNCEINCGIKSILVDAGGDLRVGAAPPDEPRGWKLGIAPLRDDNQNDSEKNSCAPHRFIYAKNRAFATSGDTSRFVEIDGTRYSHIVNPQTGYGLTDSNIVTVAAETAMEADSLASAISVLGCEKGIELVQSRRNVSAIIVAPSGQEKAAHNWASEFNSEFNSASSPFSATYFPYYSAPRDAWLSQVRVEWNNAPFISTLERLATTTGVTFFIDRRVNPERTLTLARIEGTLREVVEKSLAPHELILTVRGTLGYITSREKSASLNAALAASQKRIESLPRSRQRLWQEKISYTIDQLSDPRESLTELCQRQKIMLGGTEKLPHDRWRETRFINVPLHEIITLILFGFDATWDFDNDGKIILALQ